MLNKYEFLHHCKDGDIFWPLIQITESMIELNNCHISLRFDKCVSSYESSDRYIRWFVGNANIMKVLPAAFAISDLFHEMGHMLQPELKVDDPASIIGSKEQLEREKEAWKIGRDILQKYNHMTNIDTIKAYDERSNYCLINNVKFSTCIKYSK